MGIFETTNNLETRFFRKGVSYKMIIKKAEYKECGECGKEKLLEERLYGCDKCKKVIPFYEDSYGYLEVVIFYKHDETKRFHFCTWECVFRFLKTVQRTKHKSDSFIRMPFLSCDDPNKAMHYKTFFKAMKKVSNE